MHWKRHNSEYESCITLLAEENSFSCSVVVTTAVIIQFDFQSFIFYIYLGRKYLFPHSLLHSGIKGFNSITFLIISVTLAAKFYHCISLTSANLITLSIDILPVFTSFSYLLQFLSHLLEIDIFWLTHAHKWKAHDIWQHVNIPSKNLLWVNSSITVFR